MIYTDGMMITGWKAVAASEWFITYSIDLWSFHEGTVTGQQGIKRAGVYWCWLISVSQISCHGQVSMAKARYHFCIQYYVIWKRTKVAY